MELFKNPFRPGAGQQPPYLAGREQEKITFQKLLQQSPILDNLVLTGLRGVGKTVLLDEFKPIASKSGWFWAGSDLSESASVSEASLAIRILTDLGVVGANFILAEDTTVSIGFKPSIEKKEIRLDYHTLLSIYEFTPGLVSDKLKKVLEVLWDNAKTKVKGIVLAYDEAQILKDRAEVKQYPLSVLLEIIQYIQKKNIPYLLVLTGLPTLYPNLVEARTYAERMFQVMTLTKLNEADTREAVLNPIQKQECPVTFNDLGISEIIKYSSGYPYFIQFFCRAAFDSILQQIELGLQPSIEIYEFVKKLDVDFYSGRWNRISDRQRELLRIIAKLPQTGNEEFTAKDIALKSKELSEQPFSPASINNLLVKFIELGLIYKNRRGKYSFGVPLLADYINRQHEDDNESIVPF